MEIIKFRAKDIDTKEWIYGYYSYNPIQKRGQITYWDDIRCYVHEVDPETVGQFTGKNDSTKWKDLTEDEKNKWIADGNKSSKWIGKKIYEEDIVVLKREDSFPSWNKAIIIYGENIASFLLRYIKPINPKGVLANSHCLVSEDKTIMFGKLIDWELKIIGNMDDNPELLKE